MCLALAHSAQRLIVLTQSQFGLPQHQPKFPAGSYAKEFEPGRLNKSMLSLFLESIRELTKAADLLYSLDFRSGLKPLACWKLEL
jgi:hypothetical protein